MTENDVNAERVKLAYSRDYDRHHLRHHHRSGAADAK